jgi:hypothetical protein
MEVSGMGPRKIALIVVGAVLALVGLGFTAAGGTLIWAHATQRDAAGFYTTPTAHFDTATYALTSQVDFGTKPSEEDWVPANVLGTVRIKATSTTGTRIFIGIAPSSDVDRWLSDVAHEHVTSVSFGPFSTETQLVSGTKSPAVPGMQSFWVASTSGTGVQTLIWPTEGGRWSAVVMNANAAPGIAANVNLGAKTGILLPIGLGLGVFGLLVLVGSALLMVFGLRRPEESPTAAVLGQPLRPETSPVFSASPSAYPVRLDGHLDPTTSRWLWLVKWLLVIPHVIVLALLWIAVLLLTVVAGFAILFTERYPKSVFDFNVGVMRWTWRVAFYAAGAFGTDRYPPFSLEPDPSYPADLVIDYPQQLSRGLVLVKWWLLAIPQYFVVAVFAGGWGAAGHGTWQWVGGGGLISLLALIAAIVLGVRGRYPESIFDFVMGMNRWCFRVLTYAALMRDEYPPFRLDSGGTDPGSYPVLPPGPSPAPAGSVGPVTASPTQMP